MELIFSTFNARYSHTSLSLRCLRANLGPLRDDSEIIEFEHTLNPQTAAEKLLSHNPKVILFSVYIWNLTVTCETISVLRTIRPSLKIVIGGPEVSYDYEDLPIFQKSDHLICGEGEGCIEQICRDLLDGISVDKVIRPETPDLNSIELPYEEYSDTDIAHRRIYVETVRGCPFTCQYCLSSLECGMRYFPDDKLFPMFKTLIERGARIFKFIDRSFNINPAHAAKVISFFLENHREGMMLHLEWEPNQLPEELKELLASAPAGFLQLEVGIQTFNQHVADRIERRLLANEVEQTVQLLGKMPSIHLHADLIAGLPGEDLRSIANGFDRLHACGTHEIQLGILKKLRGAPIAQHDREFEMVYHISPPYDVLQTSTLSFPELQALRRFARFWDITVNNGRFSTSAPLIWQDQPSVFNAFMEWSNWLYQTTHATAGFTPGRLARHLKTFLSTERSIKQSVISSAIELDLDGKKNTIKGMERQTRNTPASVK